MNPSDILFVDIETTGLSRNFDQMTSCVWFYQGAWHKWTRDLDSSAAFLRDWNQAATLCTYNGKCFDEAFICKEFDIQRHPQHCDLRYDLARQGLKGGLKRIAATQGLSRPAGLDDLDGHHAVILWDLHRQGSREALDALLVYNAYDVVLTYSLYSKLVEPMPTLPPMPWSCDTSWLDDFRQRHPSLPPSYRPTSSKISATEAQVSRVAGAQTANATGPWFGSVIAFTGQMTDRAGAKFQRNTAREVANSVGFVWVDKVVAGCTHLVAAAGAAATQKSQTARKLGITILTADEFWELVDFGHS